MQNDPIDESDIESLFCNPAASIPHLFANTGIPVKEQHFLRYGFIVFHGDEITIFPFLYGFSAPGGIRRYDRFAARHGFQYGFRGSFPVRRQNENVALRQIWPDIRLFPEILNAAIVNIRLYFVRLERRRVRIERSDKETPDVGILFFDQSTGGQILQYAFVAYDPADTEKTESLWKRLFRKSIQIDSGTVQKYDSAGRNDLIVYKKRRIILILKKDGRRSAQRETISG